jgi:hypothetical protein
MPKMYRSLRMSPGGHLDGQGRQHNLGVKEEVDQPFGGAGVPVPETSICEP